MTLKKMDATVALLILLLLSTHFWCNMMDIVALLVFAWICVGIYFAYKLFLSVMKDGGYEHND